ncbi:MAG: hypothetical protein Q7R70_01325 [Candidatus Diapherotrites archaeon]|nr:hypothetical protein [Candidatus Diapherotrites archaeon]
MKEKFFTALALIFAAGFASAIVIIPPVVYVATISILSIIFNMIAGFFCWLAIQGIASKTVFGKKLDSVLETAIPVFGKILFALLLTVVFSFFFSPSGIQEILLASAAITLVFFLALLLSNYRQIRNSPEKGRKQFPSIAVSSILVFAIVSASIFFSVTFAPISQAQRPLLDDSAFGVSKSQSAPAESISRPSTDSEKNYLTNELWLVPSSIEACKLSVNGIEQFSFTPSKNCFERTASGFEKTFCPIKITPALFESLGETMELSASGSCSGKLSAKISNNQFEVLGNE